ncbi:MAG: fused MFS/spermidine synthase [Opitutales bacterium]|jgi:protein-L-isoaspartate O-methyltransferase|nr:fused MFS/spermidine synthase [Opitutales bacterium]MDP4895442.1 fused MFS/spermidine synthase [Opitutales bacterium]MDP5013453.1 fused MFS/spermidine synthase [Opitutales bacterium]
MFAFSLTIFWGAFLLFLVQPLIARFILPWFGGGPAVWTTCMLFFQLLLLGGYAYAHFSISRLTPRRQVITHLVLLALAVALLPITPGDAWKPTDGSHAAGHILLLLLGCLGLPYLVLSATGPLLQAWFSKANPGVSPYRLYALSNVGSLLALLIYPFYLEPQLSRQAQADGWSWGLAIYAGLTAWCGLKVWKSSATDDETARTAEVEAPASAWRKLLWFALPACGVMLLLAITNKLCQDIAVVPFLWVLPLSLYLLSFIISFDSPRWYHRAFWLPLLAALLGMALWNLYQAESHPDITPLATLYLGTLFVACMVCHGEVYRLRPGASRLTGFYLSLSAGGAAGGLFVALVAPFVFPDYFELHLALFLTAALVLLVLRQDPTLPLREGRARWAWAVPFVALAALGYGLVDVATTSLRGSLSTTRGFYGVLKVNDNDADIAGAHHLTLQHGATIHGLQYVDPEKRTDPSSYYTSTSGIGRLLRAHKPGGGRRVGAIGLGCGTLAAWGRAGDTFRFYEINDDVARLATSTFTYLKDSKAKTELVMGDARLSMEREADQQYDVIVLDAFSSDAIPVHLLTLEAFDHYKRHLKPDGAIVVHVSNRYLDLHPVVYRIADKIGFPAITIDDNDTAYEEAGFYGSDWIIMTRNQVLLQQPLIRDVTAEAVEFPARIMYWTDERSDLLSILSSQEGSFLRWLQGL